MPGKRYIQAGCASFAFPCDVTVPTVRDFLDILQRLTPPRLAEDWDNVGLLCGHFDAPVDTVLVALDPMPDVIDEAKKVGAQCIVTHHPLIFEAPRAINDESYTGRCILALAEAHIAAINLHTNLDVCPGGVNDVLAETLGLADVSVLDPIGQDAQGRPYGLIRTGMVQAQSLAAFAAFVRSALGCPGLRFADAGRPVRRVAVGGGSCGGAIDEVLAAGCDTLVTADLKYNHFEEAKYRGLNLLDAGHFETENPVCAVLARILREALPELTVLRAKAHKDETQFL